jgi:hypothetical protein
MLNNTMAFYPRQLIPACFWLASVIYAISNRLDAIILPWIWPLFETEVQTRNYKSDFVSN